MLISEWLTTNRETASVVWRARELGVDALAEEEALMWNLWASGGFREWENSFYQCEQGLFSTEEFQPRIERWRRNLSLPAYRDVWITLRETFAPSFRAEIDRIVAEVGG